MPIKYIKTVKLSIKAISSTGEEGGGWKSGKARRGEHERLIGLDVSVFLLYQGN